MRVHATAGSLVARLESIYALSEPDKAVLSVLPMQVEEVGPHSDIVRELDRPSRCVAILDGLACTYKTTGNGKRQITAFHIAGDTPDLQSLHLDVLDNSIQTITACRIGFIQHKVLHELCEAFPRITAALWRTTLIDAAISREWIMNLGQRLAAARIAHLLCEQIVRYKAVGMGSGHTYYFQITQADLADAVGLSNVHVNRTLQQLRELNLINWKGSHLSILDWDGLKRLSGFDAAYLHMRDGRSVI